MESLGSQEGLEYIISGEAAINMMEVLVEIVLAFLSVQEAKSLIDRLAAKEANEIAEQLEDKKFGN